MNKRSKSGAESIFEGKGRGGSAEEQRKDGQKTERPGRNGELEARGSYGDITNKVKCDNKMRRKSGLRGWGGEPLLASMRTGSLRRWRQMTDGSVLRREREVTRGGGKPHHPGKE